MTPAHCSARIRDSVSRRSEFVAMPQKLEMDMMSLRTTVQLRSKLAVSFSVLFSFIGLCLWGIPLFAAKTFGVYGRWAEPSNYYFTALGSGIVAFSLAFGLVKPENKCAKILRWSTLATSTIVVMLAILTILLVGMISIGMGLSLTLPFHGSDWHVVAMRTQM